MSVARETRYLGVRSGDDDLVVEGNHSLDKAVLRGEIHALIVRKTTDAAPSLATRSDLSVGGPIWGISMVCNCLYNDKSMSFCGEK